MIGILCGLRSEAKIADKIPNVIVGCTGARPERAALLVQQLVEQGASRLISFGLCGGVSPDLVAGDLLLGSSVMTAKEAWETDTSWNDLLIERMDEGLCVPVWGSDLIAAKAEDKDMIFRRTGCYAVDMESHIVARAAQEHGLLFNIVRAVSDPFDMTLPEAARVPLREDGTVDFKAVWQSVKAQPRQIPDLIRLGLSTAKAMRTLKRVVDVIAEVGV